MTQQPDCKVFKMFLFPVGKVQLMLVKVEESRREREKIFSERRDGQRKVVSNTLENKNKNVARWQLRVDE